MRGDRWTFLVVRGEDTAVRQYSLSTRALRRCIGVGLCMVLLLVGFGSAALLDGTVRLQARSMMARNRALLDELALFGRRVNELEGSIDRLAEKDTRIRVLAGLEIIDPEVMQAGVGGPGFGALESYSLWSVDSTASKVAFALSYDINALERRARMLSSSMDEAADSLSAHHELLQSMPSILPTAGWLSSGFSRARLHPIFDRALPHLGVDIAAAKGTPIFAAAKGRIAKAAWRTGYGLTIEIDHGFGYRTLYGHASRILVRPGQNVQRGDVVGQVGNTGIATSSHLHYEVSLNGVPQNPANFILPSVIP